VNGHSTKPVIRQRLADAYIGLTLTRLNGLRAASEMIGRGTPRRVAAIAKLQWSTWHQQLGELSMDLMGQEGLILADGDVGDRQYSFQFARAETIFAGTSEIHRNIIGERVLGLPRGPG
jgi:alkylation response protein AidB-like acyl-CoA dehydrogenase